MVGIFGNTVVFILTVDAGPLKLFIGNGIVCSSFTDAFLE